MCYTVYSKYGCNHTQRGETYVCPPNRDCQYRGRPYVREVYSGARCGHCLNCQNTLERREPYGQAYHQQDRNYYDDTPHQRERTHNQYSQANWAAHRQAPMFGNSGRSNGASRHVHHIETARNYYECRWPCCAHLEYAGFPSIEALERHQDAYRRQNGY